MGGATNGAGNGVAGTADGGRFRQWPAAAGTTIQGALAHVDLESLARRGGDGRVRFAALPVTGLLVLRGDPARAKIGERAQAALGLELPAPLRAATSDGADVPPGSGRVLRWRSPDEWLLSCPIGEADALGAALEDGLGDGACTVDVSGGYTRFELTGEGVDDVLRRSTSYDVGPDGLPVGKVVGTGFAKTTVLLRRIAAQRVELVVRRSFADYVWTWLQRTAPLTVELPPGA